MHSFKLLVVAMLTFSGLASAAPVPYEFDASHTRIAYAIDHMGLSVMQGRFARFEGSLLLDVNDLPASKVSVSIDVSSIDSGVPKLDEHLQAPDFFDVAQFPRIQFESTKVEGSGNQFKVTGDLTLHGVTKPVTLDVSMRTVDSHPMRKVPAAGFVARTEIKRADFGIAIYPGMLGDTVQIRIDTEAAARGQKTEDRGQRTED
ncbi:MAG: YceI family protein [Lysobacterales bacterium]